MSSNTAKGETGEQSHNSSDITAPSVQEERREFTDEEKLAVLDMVATDGFVEVSRELGIPKATLRSWKRRAKRGLITAPAASISSSTNENKRKGATEEAPAEEGWEDKETVLALASEHGVETMAREMGIPEDVIRAWQAAHWRRQRQNPRL